MSSFTTLLNDLPPATTPIDFTRPFSPSILSNRFAIVTGGASGIGADIVRALARAGARVAILDRDADLASTVAKEIGERARWFECDVSSWEGQAAAFKEAVEWAGSEGGGQARLDVVVTAAGVRGNPLRQVLAGEGEPVEPPVTTLQVNLIGSYYSTYLALHYFASTRAGDGDGDGDGEEVDVWRPQLVFVSSLAGYEATANVDYTASKFGVRGLWQSVRMTEREDIGAGVQANLLAPTFVATPLIERAREKLVAAGFKIASVGDVVSSTCLTVFAYCVCLQHLPR